MSSKVFIPQSGLYEITKIEKAPEAAPDKGAAAPEQKKQGKIKWEWVWLVVGLGYCMFEFIRTYYWK
jgi:hypothetical protein